MKFSIVLVSTQEIPPEGFLQDGGMERRGSHAEGRSLTLLLGPRLIQSHTHKPFHPFITTGTVVFIPVCSSLGFFLIPTITRKEMVFNYNVQFLYFGPVFGLNQSDRQRLAFLRQEIMKLFCVTHSFILLS